MRLSGSVMDEVRHFAACGRPCPQRISPPRLEQRRMVLTETDMAWWPLGGWGRLGWRVVQPSERSSVRVAVVEARKRRASATVM